MIGQLAARLRITPLEVYCEAIRAIGGNYYVTPIKNEAVAHYKRIWETHGIGWICEEMGHSKLDGYTNVISYYGSSEYDTRQMSRLIDLIVMECKEQGIENNDTERTRFTERRLEKWMNVSVGFVGETATAIHWNAITSSAGLCGRKAKNTA